MLSWATTALGCAGFAFVDERDVHRQTLLKNLDYQAGDGWVVMERDLTQSIPSPTLAPGFTIRSVQGLEDAEERARVLAAADGDTVHPERYRTLMRTPGYDRELDVVAVSQDGRFASFAMGWLDATNQVALFESVGTDPVFRRRGLARAVLCEGLQRFRQRGAKRATLSTGMDDFGPIQLYRSVGFVPQSHVYMYRKALNGQD